MTQIGAHRVRKMLTEGKTGVLKNLRLEAHGTTLYFKKTLQEAPLIEVLEFLDNDRSTELKERLLQQADDLNYLQELISALGKEASLNPPLNAVIEAFNRRRFYNRFKTSGKSVELDILLNQSTQGTKDDDELCVQSTTRTSPRLCFSFQREGCTRTNCIYQHRCSLCWAVTHPAIRCPRVSSTEEVANRRSDHVGRRTTLQRRTTQPPHPRFRRDRATDRGTL